MTLEKFNEHFKLTAQGKELDERIKTEYQDQFEWTNKNLLNKTEGLIALLKKNDAEKNFYYLLKELKFTLPILAYMKNYEIDGKMYDVEIDLLTLEWNIN